MVIAMAGAFLGVNQSSKDVVKSYRVLTPLRAALSTAQKPFLRRRWMEWPIVCCAGADAKLNTIRENGWDAEQSPIDDCAK